MVCLKAPFHSQDQNSKKKSKNRVPAEKDKFVSLKESNKSIESITFSEAVELLKYPYELGEYEGETIKICSGRYGLYFKFKDKNWSLKGMEEPSTIDDIKEYFDAIKNKSTDETNQKKVYRKITDNIIIKDGKYGPYIQYTKEPGKKPLFVPLKKVDYNKVTEDECMALINQKMNYSKGYKSKNTSSKTKK